jgi:hypothetical protein
MSLISTTFSKVSPVYYIHSFDYGFALEINGFTNSEQPTWKTIKIAAMTEADLQQLITEVNTLPKVQ